jgi:nicotinamidase-related amidase
MTTDRTALIAKASDLVEHLVVNVESTPELTLDSLPQGRTALVIVDMVNGFAREGALASPRVEALIPAIARLLEACRDRNMPVVAFADAHPTDSVEFQAYPPHCIAGTSESEMVAELKAVGGYTLIPKNSTNGFLEPAFQAWLQQHPAVDTFLVVGDCTDICVLQFALALKTDFTRRNRNVRIIVPADAVDTFDAPFHPGDFMHVIALNLMLGGGIEVVSRIV